MMRQTQMAQNVLSRLNKRKTIIIKTWELKYLDSCITICLKISTIDIVDIFIYDIIYLI